MVLSELQCRVAARLTMMSAAPQQKKGASGNFGKAARSAGAAHSLPIRAIRVQHRGLLLWATSPSRGVSLESDEDANGAKGGESNPPQSSRHARAARAKSHRQSARLTQMAMLRGDASGPRTAQSKMIRADPGNP